MTCDEVKAEARAAGRAFKRLAQHSAALLGRCSEGSSSDTFSRHSTVIGEQASLHSYRIAVVQQETERVEHPLLPPALLPPQQPFHGPVSMRRCSLSCICFHATDGGAESERLVMPVHLRRLQRSSMRQARALSQRQPCYHHPQHRAAVHRLQLRMRHSIAVESMSANLKRLH